MPETLKKLREPAALAAVVFAGLVVRTRRRRHRSRGTGRSAVRPAHPAARRLRLDPAAERTADDRPVQPDRVRPAGRTGRPGRTARAAWSAGTGTDGKRPGSVRW